MSGLFRICSRCSHPYTEGMSSCPSCGADGSYAKPEDIFLSGQYPGGLAPIELPSGTLLVERFLLEEKLGQGRFSQVYLAMDNRRETKVALKVATLHPGSDQQVPGQRFHSEANLFTRVTEFNHILQMYDLHCASHGGLNLLLLSMEYADGGTLRAWLHRNLNIRESGLTERLALFLQACRGVRALHKSSIWHLDLKPENLLFVGTHLKVADLGTAYCGSLPGNEQGQDIGTISLEFGTPVYMSPEQFIVAHPSELDHRSDIYALGVILYEIVNPSGQAPFGGSVERIRDCHLNTPPRRLKEIDEGLFSIISSCLAKDPDDRFDSISDLIDSIEQWLEGEPVTLPGRDSGKDDQPDIEWDRAQACFDQNDLTSANLLVEEILSKNPRHQEARRLKSEIDSRRSQVEELLAETQYRLDQGELEAPVSLLVKAAEIYPDHPDAIPIQTKVALMSERFARSMESGREALLAGRPKEALGRFQEAARVNLDTPNVTDLIEMLEQIEDNRLAMNQALTRGDLEMAGQLAGLVDSLTLELEYMMPEIGGG